jgi:hypothetical protein
MVRGLVALVLLSGLIVAVGCGGSTTPTAAVSGDVLFNSKPVPDGEIHFVGEGQGKAPEILPIKNGKFSGNVTIGKKKVEIYAYKEGKAPVGEGGYKPEGGGPSKENYIPAEFNVTSNRTEEIKADQENKFTIEITKY